MVQSQETNISTDDLYAAAQSQEEAFTFTECIELKKEKNKMKKTQAAFFQNRYKLNKAVLEGEKKLKAVSFSPLKRRAIWRVLKGTTNRTTTSTTRQQRTNV